MSNRTVRFQIHIRPLFSAMDREHMSFFADLWDVSTFYSADGKPKMDVINKIFHHVGPGGNMPPVTHGGGWPEEWQNLYKRWMDEGCQKLELGQGAYAARRLGGIILSAQDVTVPLGSELWLERDRGCPSEFTYNLYIEPPANGTGATEVKSATEDIDNAPDDLQSITVITSEGKKVIPVT